MSFDHKFIIHKSNELCYVFILLILYPPLISFIKFRNTCHQIPYVMNGIPCSHHEVDTPPDSSVSDNCLCSAVDLRFSRTGTFEERRCLC